MFFLRISLNQRILANELTCLLISSAFLSFYMLQHRIDNMIEDENGNVKCWRCGMTIPYFEMKMLDSQPHCAFCYQDVLMERKEAEEARDKKNRRIQPSDSYLPSHPSAPEMPSSGQPPPRACEVCGAIAKDGHYAFSGKYTCTSCYVQESRAHRSGYCVRCGKNTDELYMLAGQQLCLDCFSSESSGKGDWAHAIKETIQRAIGIRPRRAMRKQLDRKFREEVELREAQKKQMKEEEEGETEGEVEENEEKEEEERE